jgi:hypothetical protein
MWKPMAAVEQLWPPRKTGMVVLYRHESVRRQWGGIGGSLLISILAQ